MQTAVELERRRPARMGAPACLGVALLCLIACREEASPSTSETNQGSSAAKAPLEIGRVMLIGADGLEWKVIIPLLRKGELPNIAGLMQRGRYGLLGSITPTQSPVIWTSVATGKSREKHGIRGFEKPDTKGGTLYTSRDRSTKALWNILTEFDRRVCCLGWWMTYPVEPITGIMVSQTNTLSQLDIDDAQNIWKGVLRKGIPGQVFPRERQDEMLTILEEVDRDLEQIKASIFGEFPHPPTALAKQLWKNADWSFRADTTYSRILNRVSVEEPFHLTMVYFGGTDVVGHLFWRYMEPEFYTRRPSAEQIENYGDVIPAYYRYLDRMIGEALAGHDEKLTVILASDHGMLPFNRHGIFDPDDPTRGNIRSGNHKMAPPGVIVAAGHMIESMKGMKTPDKLEMDHMRQIGTIYDITPTILAMLAIPAGRDMRGKVRAEWLREDLAERLSQLLPIATHDKDGWPPRSLDGWSFRPDEAERLLQLDALGYLGGDREDPAKKKKRDDERRDG